MSKIGNKRTRFVTRAVAVFAIVLVMLSGTVLAGGAAASGEVACSVSGSTITVTWTGNQFIVQYAVELNSDEVPIDTKIVNWLGMGNVSASVEFTGLSPGSYRVDLEAYSFAGLSSSGPSATWSTAVQSVTCTVSSQVGGL